ncbi:hypothetical protein BH20VER1_BH20VER1_29900 [soil metagenome]
MQQLAEDLWTLDFPKRLLGVAIGRVVTLIRLRDGRVVIHSTAPFTPDDVARIQSLGELAWMMDVTKFHDSFAQEGRAAFPSITYLVPEGFPKTEQLRARSLDAVPLEWEGELRVRRIDGMPGVQEHVLLHVTSRTLIVADLLFNFTRTSSGWTKLFARHVMRLKNLSGMSLFFRSMIRDRTAFHRSLNEVLTWDFERVIVGHGEPIESGAREQLAAVVSSVDKHGG